MFKKLIFLYNKVILYYKVIRFVNSSSVSIESDLSICGKTTRINNDLSVDMFGDVRLSKEPNFNLNEIHGDFRINSSINKLTKFYPKSVTGQFKISNPNIRSFDNFPKYVGELHIVGCRFSNLDNCPNVSRLIYCYEIPTLTHINQYIPNRIISHNSIKYLSFYRNEFQGTIFYKFMYAIAYHIKFYDPNFNDSESLFHRIIEYEVINKDLEIDLINLSKIFDDFGSTFDLYKHHRMCVATNIPLSTEVFHNTNTKEILEDLLINQKNKKSFSRKESKIISCTFSIKYFAKKYGYTIKN